jgi:predicted phage terminase large subunit-like protein
MRRYRQEVGIEEYRRMVASRFSSWLPSEADDLDLLGWGRRFLPHYYTRPPSRMHRWFNRAEKRLDRRGQRIVMVGPRSGAKSVVGNLTVALKRSCSGRESFILICSDTVTQAIDHIRSIKEELESNAALEHAYPEACGVGPIWQDKLIQMRNGTVIRAVGTLSRIRGFRRLQNRPSLIIVDDPENDEHITSARMRQRVRTWFNRTLLPMGDKRTNILAMGTSIHRDCLVMSLLRTAGWYSTRDTAKRPAAFKSIIDWPVHMDLWDRWERLYQNVDNPHAEKEALQFYREHREAMREGVKLLWPGREGLYYLMRIRAEMGHQAFEAEKQSNPLNPETCEWPEEYFEGADLWFDKWPDVSEHACRVVALDPSKGKNANHGDYSSFAKVCVDYRGVFYVDVDMERRPTDKICRDAVPIIQKFRPHKFGIEVNQFQELLAEDLSEVFRENGIEVDIEPIDNRVKKTVRIRRLSPLLHQRRIRFRAGSSGAIRCVEQLRDFPNGDHDDGPDSLEMACRLAADMIGEPLKLIDGIGDQIKVDYA